MEEQDVSAYFDSDAVVDHYAKAAANVGLWVSEEKIFTRVFRPEQTLLELGCGCGRITFGMYELGFRNIIGTDVSRPMVKQARRIAAHLEIGIPFRVANATDLAGTFGENVFDGAIFGFNGLMQIPRRERRLQAMREVLRVLRPGAYFVFTAHDRDLSRYKSFWQKERTRWSHDKRDPRLDDYGDRYAPTPLGDLYIHVPTRRELIEDLKAAGFRIEADVLRRHVANEPPEVRVFSDETRFWVVQKPEESGGEEAREE